ncbi:MAG: YkgJ family cysteine cluster protein [Chloroflexi bacterium]|nr:YkgJ family cysteine cluster protein [Chloroflexota bacterium]
MDPDEPCSCESGSPWAECCAARLPLTLRFVPVRLLTTEDTVMVGCSRGGHCCYSVHVPLTAFDVLRLSRFLGTTTTAVLSGQTVITEEGGVEIDGEPACPFLAENQCTVYPARPDACRMYPFWQISSGRHQWLVERHTCAGCWSECRTIPTTGAEMLADAGVEAGREAEAVFQAAIRQIEESGAGTAEVESFMAEVYDSDSIDTRGSECAEGSDAAGDTAPAGGMNGDPESYRSEDSLRCFTALVDRLLVEYLGYRTRTLRKTWSKSRDLKRAWMRRTWARRTWANRARRRRRMDRWMRRV